MMSLKLIFPVLAALVMAGGQVFSQSDLGSQLAELTRLKEKVADSVTRTRVDGLHRVWTIG
ncbi:MAG: hypothetical protein H6Q04_2326, partial [Acidobacteria bacterium]|nr:hypothetical protein [Acidobacteriota bacterium]